MVVVLLFCSTSCFLKDPPIDNAMSQVVTVQTSLLTVELISRRLLARFPFYWSFLRFLRRAAIWKSRWRIWCSPPVGFRRCTLSFRRCTLSFRRCTLSFRCCTLSFWRFPTVALPPASRSS